MVQEITSGLALGCIYALVSFGFVLVYSAVGTVNFAHGELVMLGGYFGLAGSTWLGLPLWACLIFSLAAMCVLGFLFNRFSYYPVRSRPVVVAIITSIGMSIVLRNGALIVWGPDSFKLHSLVGDDTLTFGGAIIPEHYILIIVITALIFVGQFLFFSRTSLGRKLEATAQDQQTARLMGIRVSRMISLTFMISACLAAIAGFMLGPIWFLEPNVGLYIILKAFIVIVIGGFGSIYGILLGGLFLGVTEILVASHLTSEYKDAISFLILVAVLLVLPQGFFGEKIAKKM